MNRNLKIFIALSSFWLVTGCNLDKIEDPGISGEPPVAAFDIGQGVYLAPCLVSFINNSVNTSTQVWSFGDGTPVSTDKNPVHTYTEPGEYTVTLSVTGNGGADIVTKVITINAVKFIKNFGEGANDAGFSLKQTADGGYILSGYSTVQGNNEIHLIKTDNTGALTWKQTFGEPIGNDYSTSVQITPDGGYILTGLIWEPIAAQYDLLLSKMTANGTLVWQKKFGGSNREIGWSVINTTDGGYLALGETMSMGAGGNDFFLVKTDSDGNLQWQKTYGAPGYDAGYSIVSTTDGGYILVGDTDQIGAGSLDMYLIKIDAGGNSIWDKTIGTAQFDNARSVVAAADGGFILLGSTFGTGAGLFDMFLVKSDKDGNEIWQRTFGGAADDAGIALAATKDGGYVATGYTESEGPGGRSIFVVKTDANGLLQWKKTYGGANSDEGLAILQTTDGGYAILGYAEGTGNGQLDIYLIKTDKDGNAQ